MKAYRFETKVSKEGIIQIPYSPDFYDQEVEVILLPKSMKIVRKFSAKEFVEKWAGFLQDDNLDEARYNYLSEKYK